VPTVRVPATSANLGPGFDAYALALGVYDQYNAEPADEWTVTVSGEAEGEIPASEEGRVAVSMSRLFDVAGEGGRAAAVECLTRVPPGRGLGSSAGATVAGLLLANAMVETRLSVDEVFALAADIEGHADNVAATLYGGFTLSWYEDEAPRAVRLEPCAGLASVAIVSDRVFDTEESRGVIPQEVPMEAAAFNAGRAGLLAAGLLLNRADLAAVGLDDRIHQPYRSGVVSDLDTVSRALVMAGCDGAVLSGAGPTVLGILLDVDDSTAFRRAVVAAERVGELVKDLPDRRDPVALPVDRRGAAVL
jgi:homoserine kinase